MSNQVTQSKSKTTMKRSMHSKFNCISVKYNGKQHGIYIILEVHQKFIIQIHFILLITKQLQYYTICGHVLRVGLGEGEDSVIWKWIVLTGDVTKWRHTKRGILCPIHVTGFHIKEVHRCSPNSKELGYQFILLFKVSIQP